MGLPLALSGHQAAPHLCSKHDSAEGTQTGPFTVTPLLIQAADSSDVLRSTACNPGTQYVTLELCKPSYLILIVARYRHMSDIQRTKGRSSETE
jgi:hypothetical protein